MVQHGFFFDQSRCTGCHACAVECKQWNQIPPGTKKWMRIYNVEKGGWPDVRVSFYMVNCYHCENPVCIGACPFNAIYKESKYGAVLIDQDKCVPQCRICWHACPYGAPQWDSNEPNAKATMCTMCIDRLEQGNKPACVMSCVMRALDFGPFADIQTNYGELKQLPDMPSESITWPAIVFKPAKPKIQLIPYDSDKALDLWKWRWSEEDQYTLPPIFDDKRDVSDPDETLLGRTKLVLKANSPEEHIYHTSDSGE